MDLASKYGTKTYSTTKPRPGKLLLDTSKLPDPNVAGMAADDHELMLDSDSTMSADNYQLPDPLDCPLIPGIDLEETPAPPLQRKARRWILVRKDKTNIRLRKSRWENYQKRQRIAKQKKIDYRDEEQIADNCRKCNESFANEWLLASHIKSSHSNYEYPIRSTERPDKGIKRNFKCPMCPFKYLSIQHLARHTIDVHRENTIDPETRLPVEPNSQPCTKCELCGKIISGQYGLRSHILSAHTAPENRPYPCDFDGCSSSYITPADLVEHRRVHKNLKLYSCPHEGCKSKFVKKDRLKIHIDGVHKTEDRIFKCQFCGHESKSRTSRLYHMKKIHGRKDRQCPHCNFVTLTNGNLRLHIKNMHKETLENGKVSKEDEARMVEMSKQNYNATEKPNILIEINDKNVKTTTQRKRKAEITTTTIEVDPSYTQIVQPKTLGSMSVRVVQPTQKKRDSTPSSDYQVSGQEFVTSDRHLCEMCEHYFNDLLSHYRNYHRISSRRYLNALTSG